MTLAIVKDIAAPAADPFYEQRLAEIKASPSLTESVSAFDEQCSNLPVRAVDVIDGAHGPLIETTGIKLARQWYSGDTGFDGAGRIAILAGPCGTGKTVAACWLVLRRFRIYPSAFNFYTASQLARMPRDGAQRESLLEEAFGYLFIDDLGREHVDPKLARGWIADLDELIDAFYRGYGTAVITTNLTAREFRQQYGERVTDRLRECGEWIPVKGESMRGKPPEKRGR